MLALILVCLNACAAAPPPLASICTAAAYDEAELTCYAEQAERCDWTEYRTYTPR